MAQADYVVANGTGAAVRSDLNGQLAAIVSNNSGVTEPATMYAYQWWADTTTGLLKLRNAANNAWITIGTLADANLGLLSRAGGTLTGALLADDSGTAALPAIAFDGDPNTGIFRAGADQLGIATNGVERLRFGAAGQIGIGGATYGSAGQVLISNGAATAPAWQTLEAFPAGTVMLFQQTSAPTGWTKITTHNNKALRVVSGSAGSGGATAFTSVFASRTPAGSVSGSVSGSNSGGGVNGHTLSTHEMPNHNHNFEPQVGINIGSGLVGVTRVQAAAGGNGVGISGGISATGGNGSHAHGFSPPSWSGSFSGSFSGSAMDFNVQYVDVIFASKN
jgi:hypothetical protein